MFEMSIFSERLKDRMKEKGMTQTKLSEETGIPQRTISDYVKGRTVPNVLNTNLLCIALKVSADYLLGLSADSAMIDYAAIADQLGLSEKSISKFIVMKNERLHGKYDYDLLSEFNDLLEYEGFTGILELIGLLKYYSQIEKESGENSRIYERVFCKSGAIETFMHYVNSVFERSDDEKS